VQSLAKNTVRNLLSRLGYRLVRVSSKARFSSPFGGAYIRCTEYTQRAAEKNMSVVAYIEQLWGAGDAVRAVVERMRANGCLNAPARLCEIGPGTGMYLEKIQALAPDAEYIIYETDNEWADSLQSRYKVTRRTPDGISLSDEPDASCDLVHAHGVFVYLSLTQTHRYLKEMIRVVRPGGFVVFDFYDAERFDLATIERWLANGWSWPVVLAYPPIRARFEGAGLTLADDFMIATNMEQTPSRYLVFRRPV
jgi:SAM-dependent methyltransferase